MMLAEKLAWGLGELGIPADATTQLKLLDYLALLEKWNKVHNLTAVRDPLAMVFLHLLDSLAVLPYIGHGRLLDVGSGAGLPGIPIALARPDLKTTLLDTSHKKTSFLRHVKATLDIANLEVVCGRAEQFRPGHHFDSIISRAFSNLSEFVDLTRHLLADTGVWLAMKGVYPFDELTELQGLRSEVLPLRVPGIAAQRHLVILKAA